MVKIKQIEKFSYNESNLVLNQIFSYNSNTEKFENNVYYTSNNVVNTIISRDSNGRAKIADPLNDYDIVNLRSLSNYISKDNLFSNFENTNTISWSTSNNKIRANAIAGGLTGDIQKNVNGILSSSAYIKENTTDISVKILKTSAFYSENLSTALFYIGHLKTGSSGSKFDLAIENSSYDIQNGPSIQFLAHKNTLSSSVLSKSSIIQNQSLAYIEFNGAISSSQVSKAMSFQIFSDSIFSTSVSSHFELTQIGTGNNDLIIKSTSSGDIIFGNAIQVGNSSENTTGLIKFNGTHFQGYNGSNWLDLDLGGGSGISTLNDIISTVDIGGLKKGDIVLSGTTLEDFINQLITPYIQPSFDNFIIDSNIMDEYIEVGRTMTISNAIWSYIVDSDNNQPVNITITGAGFNQNTILTTSPSPADAQVTTLSISNAVPYSWIISGYDKNSIQISKSYIVNGRYRFSFGASSTLLTNISTAVQATDVINSLQQMWLIEGHELSVTCTSDNKNINNYTYIAYASTYGQLLDIDKDGLDILTAFTFIGAFNYINPHNNAIITPYYIYRSNATGAFSSGNVLNIS